MNTSQSSGGVTRRSFIKRSVVAAVAVSSMTIFSGLVNAAQGDSKYCVMEFEDVFREVNGKLDYLGSHCWFSGGDACLANTPKTETCGVQIGDESKVVTITCGVDRDKNNFARCINDLWQDRYNKNHV